MSKISPYERSAAICAAFVCMYAERRASTSFISIPEGLIAKKKAGRSHVLSNEKTQW